MSRRPRSYCFMGGGSSCVVAEARIARKITIVERTTDTMNCGLAFMRGERQTLPEDTQLNLFRMSQIVQNLAAICRSRKKRVVQVS
jgi:hypothetical protein